jgi:hypothetical protein
MGRGLWASLALPYFGSQAMPSPSRSRPYALAKDLADKAFDAWRVVCLRQVFIPAPNVAALRWKQDWVRRNNGAGCSEIGLAIAQDERALAGRLAAVAKQQAGRKQARQH